MPVIDNLTARKHDARGDSFVLMLLDMKHFSFIVVAVWGEAMDGRDVFFWGRGKMNTTDNSSISGNNFNILVSSSLPLTRVFRHGFQRCDNSISKGASLTLFHMFIINSLYGCHSPPRAASHLQTKAPHFTTTPTTTTRLPAGLDST